MEKYYILAKGLLGKIHSGIYAAAASAAILWGAFELATRPNPEPITKNSDAETSNPTRKPSDLEKRILKVPIVSQTGDGTYVIPPPKE